MTKSSLRREMLRRRDQLPEEVRVSAGAVAQQRVAELSVFECSKSVALYSAVRGEVDTRGLFSAARKSGKTVAFPRVKAETLEFVVVDSLESLQPGRFGLLEPVGERLLSLAELSLIVVPGVAFARSGARLGYGKGYYDRTLMEGPRPHLVGVCYGFQLVEQFEVDAHDVPMDYVVTESEVLQMI